jgi:hypothetical protein
MGYDLAIKAQKGMLRRAAEPIKQEIVARCPVGDTGNLANSIRITTHRDKSGPGFHVRVGPRAPHAHLIHLGHRTRVPRKGYGGLLKYWRSYWAKKMHGEFIKGGALTAAPNPFVTVAGDKRADDATAEAARYLEVVVKRYARRARTK